MVGVANLLSGLEGAEDIVSDVTQYTLAKRDPNNEGGTPISAVVAKCSNQVVGVAVLRTEQVISTMHVIASLQIIIFLSIRSLAISGHTITLRTLFISVTTVLLSMLGCATSSSTQSLLLMPNT